MAYYGCVCKYCYISIDFKQMLDTFNYCIDFLDNHNQKPAVVASFAFEQIKDVCVTLDSESVNGKILSHFHKI